MLYYIESQSPKSRTSKFGLFLLIIFVCYSIFVLVNGLINDKLNSYFFITLLFSIILLFFLNTLLFFRIKLFCGIHGVRISFWPFKSFEFKWSDFAYIELATSKKIQLYQPKSLFFNAHYKIFYGKGLLLRLKSGEVLYLGCKNPIQVMEVAKKYHVETE